jgi:hypothetical protein
VAAVLQVRSKQIDGPTTMRFPGEALNEYVVLFVGDNRVEFPFATRVWTPAPADLRRVKEFCESDERAALRAALEAEPAEDADGGDDGSGGGGGVHMSRADVLDAMLFDVVERTVLDAGGVTDDDAQWQRRKRWFSGQDEDEDEVRKTHFLSHL